MYHTYDMQSISRYQDTAGFQQFEMTDNRLEDNNLFLSKSRNKTFLTQ